MSNVDKLYSDIVSGEGSANAVLDRHGPQIDVWPTDYKTIGFGAVGEKLPSAAYCIGAVGALAVRAEAGDTSAASRLSSAISDGSAGITLQSAVMLDAIDSIKRGGGLHATIAIATNLVHNQGSSSLQRALLSPSTLSVLGESVGDISGGTHSSSASKIARGGNELGTSDGQLVVTRAKEALEANLKVWYGVNKFGGTQKQSILLAHAYAALAKRAPELSRSKADAGAKVWLGALVEICDGMDSDFRESVLEGVCLEEYQRAKRMNITGRSRAASLNGSPSINLPSRRRSATDAVIAKIPKGIPQANRSNIPQPLGDDAEPLSFSSKEFERRARNPHMQYMEILVNGLEAYRRCQEQVEGGRSQLRARRAQIEEGLLGRHEKVDPEDPDSEDIFIPGLFVHYPHLDPQAQGRVMNNDQRYLDVVHHNVSSQLIERVALMPQLTNRSPEERAEVVAQWQGELAAVIAGLSFQNNPHAKEMLKQRALQHHALEYLKAHLELFRTRHLSQLDPSVLNEYGLRPGDGRAYIKISNELPEMQPTAEMDTPPLHLTQLAADIINSSDVSLLAPGNLLSKVSSRVPGRRKSEAAEEASNGTLGAIVDAAGDYVIERFQYTGRGRPNRRMIGLLLECDLAERRGLAAGATPELRRQLAQRVVSAARAGVQANLPSLPWRKSLPSRAQQIVTACENILGEQL